ncbi:C40 family peptidase [Pasteuria penetrans]|uniref:C40 family peptidase n=1 Tax=Pasteuria penetrans TaxID=86005 RepID=UPI000F97A460|nr:NlpC/P60 family protein [Pasteuria penetrans]
MLSGKCKSFMIGRMVSILVLFSGIGFFPPCGSFMVSAMPESQVYHTESPYSMVQPSQDGVNQDTGTDPGYWPGGYLNEDDIRNEMDSDPTFVERIVNMADRHFGEDSDAALTIRRYLYGLKKGFTKMLGKGESYSNDSGVRRCLRGEGKRLIGTSHSKIDCSSLVQQVARKCLGKNIPRTAQEQSRTGKSIPVSSIKNGGVRDGDIISCSESHSLNHITHSGICLMDDNGTVYVLHCPDNGVRIQKLLGNPKTKWIMDTLMCVHRVL